MGCINRVSVDLSRPEPCLSRPEQRRRWLREHKLQHSVVEHTDPNSRNSQRSELYRAWDQLEAPCVAIYLLAEWDPPPIRANPGLAPAFDNILLAEVIWQVVLRTSAQGNMSEFTEHLREQGPGNVDLISNVWIGCNVNSALEKIKTGRQHNRHAY
jgi:hypothetical protein